MKGSGWRVARAGKTRVPIPSPCPSPGGRGDRLLAHRGGPAPRPVFPSPSPPHRGGEGRGEGVCTGQLPGTAPETRGEPGFHPGCNPAGTCFRPPALPSRHENTIHHEFYATVGITKNERQGQIPIPSSVFRPLSPAAAGCVRRANAPVERCDGFAVTPYAVWRLGQSGKPGRTRAGMVAAETDPSSQPPAPSTQHPISFGGPCRTRTYDQPVKSRMLYQLS